MTDREAADVAGKLRRFRVVLDSAEGREKGWVLYDVKGPNEDDLYTLWIPDGGGRIRGGAGDELTVGARPEVIRHEASQGYPARTQYRLVAARQGQQAEGGEGRAA